ncbi:Clr5 domain-containing protein [Apodospora peruviana]|uniref:Clr5 domain-containing protein n=1 Tax=Apodospora peruviana TaxID=516989 RepID=A0AAE0HTR9_9PEZI|nr:Clr5 domain-containing protein [Apodospora peruviana]
MGVPSVGLGGDFADDCSDLGYRMPAPDRLLGWERLCESSLEFVLTTQFTTDTFATAGDAVCVDPQALILYQPQPSRSDDDRNVVAHPVTDSCDTPQPSQHLVPLNQASIPLWESKKSVIEHLYLNMNLLVNDVIEVMKKSHEFSATRRMYRRKFEKWGWQKYNKRDRGTKTCIRSKNETSRLKSNLAGPVDEFTTPSAQDMGLLGIWVLLGTQLFTRPVDDEITQHKGRVAQDMPSFVLKWLDTIPETNTVEGPFRTTMVNRLISNCADFFRGLHELVRSGGSPVQGRLYLDSIFGRIAREVELSNLEGIVLF